MKTRFFSLLMILGVVTLGVTLASAAKAPSSAVVGIPIDPSSLNPIQQMGEVAVILSQQINEPLVVLGPDAKFKPWLATSWKVVNPTTWRFQLRKGVKFTNGEPFNAQAVKFTMDEVRDPNNKAKFLPLIADVTDVKVIDDYTVEFVTKAPNPIFLVQVARLFVMPPQHTKRVGHEGYERQPMGTGAYKFVEWARGDRVVLEVNPAWWKGKAKIDRLTFRIIPEAAARVASLLSGETDIIWNVPFDSVKQIEEKGLNVLTRTGAIAYIGLDTLRGGPLADRRVRQALNYAVDAERIVKTILQGRGYAVPAAMWKITPGWDPALPIYNDPAKAKRLLQEAGFPDGFSMKLSYASASANLVKGKDVAEALQSQLGAIGVKVDLTDMEEGALGKAYSAREFQSYFFTWRSNPEAGRHLNVLLHSKIRGYYYQNPEADKLIEAYVTEMDPAKRAEAGKAVNRFLHEDAPWIFLYAQAEMFATSKRVKWDINPAASEMYLGVELAPVQ